MDHTEHMHKQQSQEGGSLILTRKPGESLTIVGEGIEFTVLGIKGNQVRIGIKAPREKKILRNELLGRVHTPK